MSNDGESDTDPFTEPLIVPSLLCSGAELSRDENVLHMVFWATVAGIGNEPNERRVIARIAMPRDVAAKFSRDVARVLRRNEN